MSRPVPFETHTEKLMAGFRNSLPQVAAMLPFLPDQLLQSVVRELELLHETAAKEVAKRRSENA